MYCSPEVADGEPRGRASDIFSLGCVFAEILTCISGQTVQEFRNRRTDDGVSFHSNLSLVVKWIEELDFEEGPSISPATCQSSTVCRKTTLDMINRDPNERPTAWRLRETFPPRPCCKQGPSPLEPVFPRVPEEELDIILSLPPSPAILPTPYTSSRNDPILEITDWRHQSHTGTGWLGLSNSMPMLGVVWQTAVILNDCVARIMQACHSG